MSAHLRARLLARLQVAQLGRARQHGIHLRVPCACVHARVGARARGCARAWVCARLFDVGLLRKHLPAHNIATLVAKTTSLVGQDGQSGYA